MNGKKLKVTLERLERG